MARSSESITPAEIQTYADWCQQNDVRCDDSAEAVANADFVGRYMRDQWKEDITLENLAKAFDALKPHLHLKTWQPYEKELGTLFASLSPQEQEAFAAWKGVRGLKSTAKAAFVIIDYCKQHGWIIDAQHLDLAAGQNRVAPFLEYEYVPQFKSKHNIVNDGKPTAFFSRDEVNKDAATYKAEAEEAYSRNRGEKTSAAQAEINQAQRECEQLRGRTHSDTEKIQKPLAADSKGNIDWVGTLLLRKGVQAALERRRQRG